ncbi:MAG TPA: CRTAC1 family protein [Deltaproteobacteria bacterium]|nr:CRTAC1 family protein [Deltaproteobacteria bacterium]
MRAPAWPLLLVACGAPAPAVVSVVPADGAVGVPVDAPFVVRFDQPVRGGTATLSAGIALEASLDPSGTELILRPAASLGSLVDHHLSLKGYHSDAGEVPPLQIDFQTELLDRLEPRPPSGDGASWRFVDVAPEVGLTAPFHYEEPGVLRPTTSGATAGDYDGDGFVDLYTGRGDAGTTHLYRNRGDGTFEDATEAAGVSIDDTSVASPSFVDLDGDGDLDLIAPMFDHGVSRVFRNDGDGTFTDISAQVGLPTTGTSTHSMAWGDPDGDLDLDVFVARFAIADHLDPGFLYLNDGTGTFTDASAASGLYFLDIQQSFTPNFADMDDDGFPELMISADHGHSVYLRNQGDGTFLVDREVELTDENGMGGTVADYDNDGDLDWFVTAIYDPNGVSEHLWGVLGNRLYQNQGDGHLIDVSEQAGVRDGGWGWGACFADLDLDGHRDLFHVNGWFDRADINQEEYGKDRSRLFLSSGDGTFVEVGLQLLLDDTSQGRGLICMDHDRDGDIDLFVATHDQPPRLFRNDLVGGGRFLNVALRDHAPNTEGVGARIYVTTGAVTQLQELRLGSNFGSNDPVEAHFGLGDVERIDRLRVRWPDGVEVEAHDIAPDRFVVVSRP